jgi:hypothetical protein
MAAIYMWPIDNQVILTTTLYPVEVVDSLQLSASISTGWMALIPIDYLEHTIGNVVITYVQERWFYSDGPYTDYLEHTIDDLVFTYVQERWFYVDGPYTDYLEHTLDNLEFTYIRKRIEVDTPDELLQLSCSINANCTMTEAP